MTSLKFEPIAPNDRDWWNQYLRRAKLINDMSDEFGKSFYKLQTFDGKTYHIHILEAEGPTLYFALGAYSTRIGIKHVSILTRDEEAFEKYRSLGDSTEKEAFLKAWFKQGDQWRPSFL